MGVEIDTGSTAQAQWLVDPVTKLPFSSANGIPVAAAALPASGLAPVTGPFTAVGVSATFTPIAGRDFNVFVASTANTTQLERQRDGATWEVALTPALLAALPPSFTWTEPQFGVAYRLNCTNYAAPQNYGISQ